MGFPASPHLRGAFDEYIRGRLFVKRSSLHGTCGGCHPGLYAPSLPSGPPETSLKPFNKDSQYGEFRLQPVNRLPEDSPGSTRQEMTLNDLWIILRKRRWLIVSFALCATLAALDYGYRKGKEYTATGEIKVQPGSASALKQSLSTLAGGGAPLSTAEAGVRCWSWVWARAVSMLQGRPGAWRRAANRHCHGGAGPASSRHFHRRVRLRTVLQQQK